MILNLFENWVLFYNLLHGTKWIFKFVNLRDPLIFLLNLWFKVSFSWRKLALHWVQFSFKLSPFSFLLLQCILSWLLKPLLLNLSFFNHLLKHLDPLNHFSFLSFSFLRWSKLESGDIRNSFTAVDILTPYLLNSKHLLNFLLQLRIFIYKKLYFFFLPFFNPSILVNRLLRVRFINKWSILRIYGFRFWNEI